MYLFFIQKWYKVFGMIVTYVIDPYGSTIHVKFVGGCVTTNDTIHLRKEKERRGKKRREEERKEEKRKKEKKMKRCDGLKEGGEQWNKGNEVSEWVGT